MDLAQSLVDKVRVDIGLSSWIQDQLRDMDHEDRADTAQRADDLFIQSLSTCALNLALRIGLEQHNQIIEAAQFANDLERLIREAPAEITDRIRLELDLAAPSDLT